MYYITFLFLALCAYIEITKGWTKRSIGTLLILCIVWFILHDGLRWGIGSDWTPYYRYFQNCLMSDNRTGFELGYALMNKFVRSFTDNYTVYLLLHAIVVYSVFYWFTKKYSPYPLMSLLVLYYSMIGYLGMNRQYLALVICLLSVPFILRHKYMVSIVIIAFACLFHISALMFVPLLFFTRRIPSQIIWFSLLIISLVSISGVINKLPFEMLFVASDDLDHKMSFYIENTSDFTSSIPSKLLGIARRGIIVFSVLLLRNRIPSVDKSFDFVFNVSLLSLLLYIFFSGTVLQILVSRGVLFYSIFEVLLIPYLFRRLNSVKAKQIAFCFLIIWGLYSMNKSMDAYSYLGVDIFRPYNAVYIDSEYVALH